MAAVLLSGALGGPESLAVSARPAGFCYKNDYGISVGLGNMFMESLGRYGVALVLFALASGCSSIGFGSSDRGGECRWNRSKCMYEGPYEPGEKDYAEQEAARLNQAEAAKLRRSSGR